MKMIIVLGAVTAALLIVGCTKDAAPSAQTEVKPAVTEESLGLRKTDLYTEQTTTGDKTQYATAAAGTSKKIDRAFVNAPPMIPHDVEDYLPITTTNNACLGCHMPEVAPAMGATPLPVSHFTNFRPATSIAADGSVVKEGKTIENTSDIKVVAKKLDIMSSARFNCSQCHAPQSQGALACENEFKPDFADEQAKHGSNLLEVLDVGVN